MFSHSSLEKPSAFPQLPPALLSSLISLLRTFHLLQKPDIFICYRQGKLSLAEEGSLEIDNTGKHVRA